MDLFVDRTHRYNVWYIHHDGKFIAGPFLKKSEAVDALKGMR